MEHTLLFSGLAYYDDKQRGYSKQFTEYGRFTDFAGVSSTWSSMSIIHDCHTEYFGYIKQYLSSIHSKKFSLRVGDLFYINWEDELFKVDLTGNHVLIFQGVYDLACTAEDVYFLTNDGKVGVFRDEIEWVNLDQRVDQISTGTQHLLMRTVNGTLYSYGCGSKGQLGHGDCFDVRNDSYSPREVEFFTGLKIRSISCGKWHNSVVSEIGDLYCWGWNLDGQLGVNDSVCPYPVLVDVNGDENIARALCGGRHTLVLSESGRVYCCGSNEWGQLGIGGDSVSTLTEISTPGNVVDVFCGDFSSFIVV